MIPPRTPADPIVVSLGDGGGVLSWEPMVRGLRRGEPIPPGTPVRDQMRAVRQALLETSFEDLERRIRDQMARVLLPAGFDPARDIEAITVNRWPHGYALATNTLFDPESPPGEEPWKVSSQPFGRITIANTDASGIDLTQTRLRRGAPRGRRAHADAPRLVPADLSGVGVWLGAKGSFPVLREGFTPLGSCRASRDEPSY